MRFVVVHVVVLFVLTPAFEFIYCQIINIDELRSNEKQRGIRTEY